ncbi:hypothetical protein ACFXOS_19750 [Streptomyces sp. NPDC059175]|uniref:hypothetical protein n=1 Tax=Streptomyces sp. NPDC059175 TaxID=3346757 RepID=UPI0036C9CC8F
MPTPYPNRARALRHVHRTRAAYLYGRFPQRYILGVPCCENGFLTQGRDHGDACLAAIERLQGAVVQLHGRIQMAYEGHGIPQQRTTSRTH